MAASPIKGQRVPLLAHFMSRGNPRVPRGVPLRARLTGTGAATGPGRPSGISRAFRQVSVVLALLLIVAILLAGLLAPASAHLASLASLLVVAPTLTAAAVGTRMTALVTLLACAASLALDISDGLMDTVIPLIHVVAILLVSGFVIAFRALRERNLRELIEVRTVSEAVQRVLLRPLPPKLGSLRVGSLYFASQPQAQVGGDLYAASRTPDGVRVLIGDVRGKGLPAVEDAAALLGAFRETAHRFSSLPRLAAYLENSIRKHFQEAGLHDHTAGERFITALIIEFPDEGDGVRIINCGHCTPLLIDGGRTVSLSPRRTSPPLGLNSLRPEDYGVDTFLLGSGSTLLLYTDGVIEARRADGDFYDLNARVTGWEGSDPDELLQYVVDGLRAHVSGQVTDDVAMVAVRRDGGDADAVV